ncbi:MAG: hypothetical protein FJ108_08240 [Deltaproteobacteria bacterium]|nr:hypothetical protein [Deltaproteobacteria bacterium]
MTPLDEIARLLAKYGHTPQALAVRSLAAREEMRVELEAFWADVAGTDLFGPTDSVAALALGGESATPSPELERDRARLRHALWLVADDLSLRGVASPDSESWRLALRAQLQKPQGADRSG